MPAKRVLTEAQKKALMEVAKAARDCLGLTLKDMGELLGHKISVIHGRETGPGIITPATEHLYRLIIAAGTQAALVEEIKRDLAAVPLPHNEAKALSAINLLLAEKGHRRLVDELLGKAPVSNEEEEEQEHEDMDRSAQATVEVMKGLASGFEKRARKAPEYKARRLREAAAKMAGVVHEYEQSFVDLGAEEPKS